ncbi:QcrA and Rieske domain-containing protein [Pontibacillus litoralis]|uniref:Menaquinol:cytochrome c reductase iron-sulfur subunit n=1 Tax=Pontibacillus litoralis JSM 072002 TaxID=1385512 RepID=A0A0A5G9U7_9BACI|nr:ubiquinol-cytochrome c reductase iron-sulfur subunit [Pontibacillus litoralis]KGX87953.1 menaquinol-cytochrome C reductase iron-sulfur subunit [Pontibacillus litoralis JSM 072002]
MSERKQQVSRRQFLNYTLTGVGGFMAAGMLAPMVRMAVDPVLQPKGEGEFIQVADVSEITTEPVRVNYKIEQVDAWYTSEVPKSAWVYKNENGDIVALSPICKHLGCVVNWEGGEGHENRFYCPCHDGLYEKNGANVPGTPPLAPLDQFKTKIKDGKLYLGEAVPNTEV